MGGGLTRGFGTGLVGVMFAGENEQSPTWGKGDPGRGNSTAEGQQQGGPRGRGREGGAWGRSNRRAGGRGRFLH